MLKPAFITLFLYTSLSTGIKARAVQIRVRAGTHAVDNKFLAGHWPVQDLVFFLAAYLTELS